MTLLYAVFIFIFGALFTSFFHVLAIRIPKKESLVGHSHCDVCSHELRLIDVLPLIGFLINKGKCHFCKTKIPMKHLVYEIIGGLLFTLSFILYGFTIDFLLLIILLSVLIIESIADIESMIVIDRIWMIGVIPLIVIRIIQTNILTYLLSASILFILMFLIAFLGRTIFKKDALGGGDIKLYIFIGLLLTYQLGLLSIFLASLFGLIYGIIFLKQRDKYIPLVPFISLAVFLSYLYGQALIDWYLNLLGM